MTTANLSPIPSDSGAAGPGGVMLFGVEGLMDYVAELSDDPDGDADLDAVAAPDAWAHMTGFHAAFLDEDHPGHARAVAQWRGLLTLFALSGMSGNSYRLSLRTVDLNGGALPSLLAEALSPAPRLTPLLNFDLSDSISVITIASARGDGEAVIGAASPMTLVAPAAGAANAPSGLAPMLVDGLCDPLSPDVRRRMRAIHWSVIAAYVRRLAAAAETLLAATDEARRRAAEALCDQLTLFAAECEAAAGAPAALKPVTMSDRAWPGHAGPSYLDETFVPDGDAEGSDAKLVIRAAGDERGFADAYLVDPALATSADSAADDIVVWENLTLQELLDPHAFVDARRRALQQDVLLLRPSDLFTDEALRMESATADAHTGPLAPWVLPLTPLALALIDAENLKDAVAIETGRDPNLGQWTRCVLTLRLTSGGAHRVEKVFSEFPDHAPGGGGRLLKMDGEDEFNPSDTLAIWPNFTSARWRHHFLFSETDARIDLSPLMAVSAGLVAADILRPEQVDERMRALQGWAAMDEGFLTQTRLGDLVSTIPHAQDAHAPWLERLRFSDEDGVVGELQRLRAIDAIAFARPDGAGRRYVGLLLVRRPPAPEPEAEEEAVSVAIDFGTTGTVAQVRIGEAYQDMALLPRVVFPAQNADSANAAGQTGASSALDSFFPLAPVSTPAPTVVLTRRMRGRAADISFGSFGFDEMGFTHMAYFEEGLGQTLDNARQGLLTYGLKWGVGKRPVAKRFLRQLVLMLAAELTARGLRPEAARWCFSYPEAFTNVERSSFRRNAVQAALDEVFGGDVVEPILYSESMAFLEHFADRALSDHGDDDKPILALDIGGGSCDVVLSSRKQLIWRNSFPIGGQVFFTDIIRHHPDFLRGLMPTDASVAGLVAAIRDADGEDAEAADSARGLIEAVLASNAFRERFEKLFPLMWDEGPALLLRSCAIVALGGVLWYMGSVLRGLIQQEEIGRLTAERVAVALGGRGSGLFRILHSEAEGPSYLSELCATLLYAEEASVVEFDPARILLTKHVKREVALGMLAHAHKHRVEAGAEVSSPPRPYVMPLASEVRLTANEDETVIPASAQVTALLQGGALRSGTDVRVEGAEHFDLFLRTLKHASGVEIQLTEEGWERWSHAVSLGVRDQIESAPPRLSEQSAHYISPPFIIGLQRLLKWLASPQDEQTRLLRLTSVQ